MNVAITIGVVLLTTLAVIVISSIIASAIVLRRLRRASRIVRTTLGPVECAVIGSGPAILVFHGGIGGWDQALSVCVGLLAREPSLDHRAALARGEQMMQDRFTLICPSRVGYLRTPLETGRTPDECADAAAALLDSLNVERAVVIGVSGGGPTALQFAIRHPQRTAALVMVAAITRRHVQPARTTESFAGRIVFARGFGWFLDLIYSAGVLYARVFPLHAARKMLRATETLDDDGIDTRVQTIRRQPQQLRWMRGLLESGYPLSARKIGLTNDLEQFAAIEDYPAERIQCPTLVVHGRHDGNVPIEHAEFVARRVSGAEILVAETCGHLLWMSEDEPHIRNTVQRFVSRCAPPVATT